MGFESDFITGVAQLLAAANVGKWLTSGTFATNDTAITMELMPPTPDNAVALVTYPVFDDPALSDSVIGLQVRTRTGLSTGTGNDPRPTNDLAGLVFNQLHGLTNATLSTGVVVEQCLRKSGALLGQDELRRWERVDNYYASVWRPSPNRI